MYTKMQTTPAVLADDSGQRIAADFRCDPAFVITDSGGHIPNG